MKVRFKNKMMQGIYELGLTASFPIPLDYKSGTFGGSNRSAWERGYLGIARKYPRVSVSYAAWCAGKEVRRRDLKAGKIIDGKLSHY